MKALETWLLDNFDTNIEEVKEFELLLAMLPLMAFIVLDSIFKFIWDTFAPTAEVDLMKISCARNLFSTNYPTKQKMKQHVLFVAALEYIHWHGEESMKYLR